MRVAIAGAGAAGLTAAWWAARQGAEVELLESQKQPGRKILISGGGRCNVLPSELSEADFFTSGSRHVLRRLLRTWPLEEVRRWFEEELGIPLVLEEETGKLFPAAQRARPVRDRLAEAVREQGARLHTGFRLERVERREEGFRLEAADGRRLEAGRLILATGGCSVPSTGSDGHGYTLAASLGHRLLPRYPALVPLTTKDAELRALAGISVPVRWRALRDGRPVDAGEGPLLFTHRGFSGPAVLDASHHVVRNGAVLEVSWGAGDAAEWTGWLRGRARRAVERAVGDLLPRRLAALLVRRAGLRGAERCGNLDRGRLDRLLGVLTAFPLPVSGHEGYRTAEVTGGGIPLDEVRPSTLESRLCPGLFLCGEILDLIGRIGGYNFHLAWITGRLAGEAAARP